MLIRAVIKHNQTKCALRVLATYLILFKSCNFKKIPTTSHFISQIDSMLTISTFDINVYDVNTSDGIAKWR